MAALLLLAIVAMNLWLNTASYKKYYSESLAASHAVAAGSAQRTIEYAVKYGKPLGNFYGMPELLHSVKQAIPEVEDVRIILPNGKAQWPQPGGTLFGRAGVPQHRAILRRLNGVPLVVIIRPLPAAGRADEDGARLVPPRSRSRASPAASP